MKVLTSDYLTGAVKKEQYPTLERPEIAFVGRSNVGKSALINRLLNRKKLAQTSSTPGKTRIINFYNINNSFHLVDLPGYGFAKVPLSVKESWRSMIEEYLTGRLPLKGVVMLVDLRHRPSPEDKVMLDYLRFYGYPKVIAATKADKISRSRRKNHLEVIRTELELDENEPLLLFSSETGEGKENMWRQIRAFLDR